MYQLYKTHGIKLSLNANHELSWQFSINYIQSPPLRVRQIKSPLFHMKLSTVQHNEQAANYYAHFTKFSLF